MIPRSAGSEMDIPSITGSVHPFSCAVYGGLVFLASVHLNSRLINHEREGIAIYERQRFNFAPSGTPRNLPSR